MKWINYHHLIYFKEIARHGSIARASEHLNVGQPALSTQLKKLEEHMGLDLFERKNRKLILTDFGKVALEYAEKISDLGQELIQIVDQKSFTKRIKFRVGAVDAIPKLFVSEIVDYAHKKTQCFLSIHEGGPQLLLKEILSHQLDLIISDQNIISKSAEKLFSTKIISNQVSAYGDSKFRNVKKNFPFSLTGQPTILPTFHSRLFSELEHFFHSNSIYMDKVAETQDTTLQKTLACRGDGIIFLPDKAAQELVKENKLINLGKIEGVEVNYFLIYPKRIIENPALKILVESFKI